MKQTFASHKRKPVKRVSFLAGLHGDELEGVYLCYQLLQYLKKLQADRPEAFHGEIHIYPAVNPQALQNSSRLWPFFSVDMNRMFGREGASSLPASSTQGLLEDLMACSDLVVDFHSSNLHLKELPQIRIIEGFEEELIPLAKECNVDIVWVHPMARVFESTLGFNLNSNHVSTLVVETGICQRIYPDLCDQIFRGMIHLLHQTDVLALDPSRIPEIKPPRLLHPHQVALVSAKQSGLFVGRAAPGRHVAEDEKLGEIIDPVSGTVLQEVLSPANGLLFTFRELPLTYAGAPLARIALDSTG